MLGNLDKETFKIVALQNDKILKTYNLPYYKEIVLNLKTNRIDIWECVSDNDYYTESIIQSIYLGKCKSMINLAYYAQMINKKIINCSGKTNYNKAIYTETEDEIIITDLVDESVISVETIDELNLLTNVISEEYARVKASSLKLKKILYR